MRRTSEQRKWVERKKQTRLQQQLMCGGKWSGGVEGEWKQDNPIIIIIIAVVVVIVVFATKLRVKNRQ